MRGIAAYIDKLIILALLLCFYSFSLFGQQTSRDNYSGVWTNPSSWVPEWTVPSIVIAGYNVHIYGYITVNGSLSFSGADAVLTVSDTLVVKGDLQLSNNSRLIVEDGGVLIVRGTVTMENQGAISANSYLIVTGSFIKTGSAGQGSFTSNDNPVKLFMGGSPDPVTLNENVNYPVLNCVAPPTKPYSSTGCSYGNMNDLASDQIYSFFTTTCGISKAGSNSPVCEGTALNLTASDGGTGYRWTGPNGFSSNIQNPAISLASPNNSGKYTLKVTFTTGCEVSDSIAVLVRETPSISVTSSSNSLCLNDSKPLTGYPAGGTFSVASGPGVISGNVLTATTAGNVNIVYMYSDVCSGSATQTVHFFDMPVSVAGPDQKLRNVFETQMRARLAPYQAGEWTLVSGPGEISDVHSPYTRITGLEVGESVFRWKVSLGGCESVSEVKINVLELFIPTVITPNGDGKNDYFTIYSLHERTELLIINRWGIPEYSDYDYKNDWDGRNMKGSQLPDDTYMFILKFENGLVKKGTVLIKR